MHLASLGSLLPLAAMESLLAGLTMALLVLKVLVGFSIIIFVHELGHFLAAKRMGVRVDRFAIGFFYRVCGYRRGEGFTFGQRPEYTPDELREKGYGETDYCLNALPFGGYVKMLGENDIIINEETGEMKTSNDPRAFTNKPVGRRMVVVSAGVVFNVVFAVLLYAVVYQFLGKEVVAPVLGAMHPGSPAAYSGLLPGDRVLSINGESTRSFEDVFMASMLGHGPLRFRVERAGAEIDHDFVFEPERRTDNRPTLPFEPLLTCDVTQGITLPWKAEGLQSGDRVTHVNGRPVSNALEIREAFRLSRGRPVEFTIERRDPSHSENAQRVKLTQQPMLLLSAAAPAASTGERTDAEHLLGFLRRPQILDAAAGQPGAEGGIQPGDVIVQWGTVLNPLYSDIIESVNANDGHSVPVKVKRGDEIVDVSVTPRRPPLLFGTAKPRVGLSFAWEIDEAVVADIAPHTPAAGLGIPRGAHLVRIGEHPVQGWASVYEALTAQAGQRVAVRYAFGGAEYSTELLIPQNIVTELGLPPTAEIVAINAQDTVRLEGGQTVRLPSAYAVRALLEKNVGRTVNVEYVTSVLDLTRHSATFQVTAENVDPWPLRATYVYELSELFQPLRGVISSNGNPLTAVSLGLQRTVRDVIGVYRIVQLMVTQAGNVGMQDVSGPIGIFRVAVRQAQMGFSDLLFFLAYISINLAVINFLPLPVVDGGLMVFLLLEKIRGKPLNLKVQVITTLAGLALIALCFVLVTFQDIVKWWGGSL